MIPIDITLAGRLVEKARLAPSAHNVQPARVLLSEGALHISAEPGRRLPVSDPHGQDMLLSNGAFIEGLALALSEEGLRIGELETFPDARAGTPFARLTAAGGGEVDPLARFVAARATWRGPFRSLDQTAREGLLAPLQTHPDLTLVADRDAIDRIAGLADEASLHFMRDPKHRRELLDWMRLSKRHPGYHRDGLNAQAMNFNPVAAIGAGLVIGPLFGALDAVGLSGALTGEAAVTRSAAAIALFHRPAGEEPLASGRAFYRAWLAMEQAGLAGRPLSVLTDWEPANAAMRSLVPIPSGRQLTKVFRIGVPAVARRIEHARLPVSELLTAS